MTRNDPASLRRALAFYEQAVALDPTFAIAWGGSPPRCRCSTPTPSPRPSWRSERGRLPRSASPSRRSRRTGIVRSPRTIGSSPLDPARALPEYEKALRLSPGRSVLCSRARARGDRPGSWNEALEHLRQSVRLDPRTFERTVFGDLLLRIHRDPGGPRGVRTRSRPRSVEPGCHRMHGHDASLRGRPSGRSRRARPRRQGGRAGRPGRVPRLLLRSRLGPRPRAGRAAAPAHAGGV